MANNNNMLQLCRLCLVKDDVNIPIFEEQGDIRQIFLKISSCLPVKVSREDRLPKKICDGCSYKLDMLYEFWNTSANAEKQLLSWLGEAGVSSKMADGAISAVAQQMRPAEVKEETLEPDHLHNVDEDDKDYLFEQQRVVEAAAAAGPSATVTSNDEEEPPPKRARRTAAVKAAIAMDQDSDDDDDSGEPLTKIEDESDDSEGEDHVPAFVDVPSTSADDQPGPSGVGKEGVEAPSNPEKKRLSKKNHRYQTRRKKKISQNSDSDPDFIPDEIKPLIKCENKSNKLNEDSKDSVHEVKKKSDKAKKRRNIKLEFIKIEKFINLNEVQTPLPCKDCPKTFTSHVELGLHSRTHNADGFFSCHQCEYRKDKKTLFKNHILNHDLWKCEKCDKIFRNKRCALKHSKTHIARSFVQCEICGKDVRNVYLDTHKKLVHADEKTVQIYKCTLCDKAYKNSTALKGHYSYNHKDFGIDTSVICDICGMRLSCKGKLAQHMRTHTGDRPYPCTVCPRKFISKDILRAHMRVHTGEKPYVCMYCGKKFAHGAPYRYHIKTHTGEKSFICTLCGKGFISRANMRIHMKSCMFPVKLEKAV